MKTIITLDETALFIEKLVDTIETQDNRGTASPIYFTIRNLSILLSLKGAGIKQNISTITTQKTIPKKKRKKMQKN